jgi:hypothetical protein
MWNCSVAVPFGTLFSANTDEPKPHQRKLIEKADASAALANNKAAAHTPRRIRIVFLNDAKQHSRFILAMQLAPHCT